MLKITRFAMKNESAPFATLGVETGRLYPVIRVD